MPQPILLAFGFYGKRLQDLRRVCMRRRFRLQPCAPADGGKTLAALCGLDKDAAAAGTGIVDDEMIVFCAFADVQVNTFLTDWRSAGQKPIRLKAVLTPTNLRWTAAMLHAEIAREDEAVRVGKAAHSAMPDFSAVALNPAEILLPREGVDLTRWACVACDQYTSQPEYWAQADEIAGEAPSALHMILPENRLDRTEELVPVINRAMESAVADGTLAPMVRGFVLTERTIPAGKRIGLVGAVDLEQYDYAAGSRAMIRPTEETIAARLPARMAIREGAPVELPHIMMLMDDTDRSVLELLYARRASLRPLYDFELMLGGGHLRGWAVEERELPVLLASLTALKGRMGDSPLFAVGDGNHSLATAKACWEKLRPTLSEEERRTHPARYALVEIENIHDPALTFEPIHRVVKGPDVPALAETLRTLCAESAGDESTEVTLLTDAGAEPLTLHHAAGTLAVQPLQRCLDDFLAAHPACGIDYVHGGDAARALAAEADTLSLLLPAMDKSRFFSLLASLGVMPRKTFSLGEANEKRYYMEARRIVR